MHATAAPPTASRTLVPSSRYRYDRLPETAIGGRHGVRWKIWLSTLPAWEEDEGLTMMGWSEGMVQFEGGYL